MADLGQAYVQIIPSADGIKGKIEEVLSPEADKAGKAAGASIGQQIGSFAKKAAVGIGIGKAISDSISNGMEFETAMAKASTLFTGTSEELGQLQSDILKMSSETGVAAAQLAEAAYSAESASVPMENLGTMIEASAKLATAGYTDIDTALSATAKTMNAYGMVSDDVAATNEAMEKVQRVLIQTQNKGITTVGELGASLANVTPTAAAAGVGFEQVGAALAVMTAQGTPTAQATTQLRSAIAELEKSGTKASSALEAAAEGSEYAGMTFTEMMANGADLGDVMGLLQGYADKTGVSMLDLWSSVEGGNAAMAIAKDVGAFNDTLGAMATEADVVGEAYETMADTTDNQMARIKESITNLGIEAFSGVAGTLSEVLNGVLEIFRNIQPSLEKLGGAFGNLFASATKVVGKMIGMKESFSASNVASKVLKTVLDAASSAIQFLADHAGILMPVLGGLAGSIAAVNIAMAVMNTNPVVLAITAVVAAIALCVTHWDLIKETVVNVGTAIMGAVKAAWGTVSGVIGGAVSGVASFIGPIWDGILETASSVWGTISTTAETVWAGIGAFISDPIGTAKDTVNEILGLFGTDLDSIWENIKGAAETAWTAVGGFVSGSISNAVNAVNTILEPFGTDLDTIWADIQTAADTAWQAVSAFISDPIGTAKEAIDTTLERLGSAIDTAWEDIQTAADTAWQTVAGFINIDSAKTAVGTAVGMITTSLATAWDGIETAADTAWQAVSAFMSDPVGTAKEVIGTVVSTLSTALGTAWEGIQSAASTAWESVSTFMSDPVGTAKAAIGIAVSGLSTALGTAWDGIQTAADTAWTKVSDFMSDPIGSAKTAIGTTISSISKALSTTWDAIKTTAVTAWGKIKTAITTPITTAKNTIKSIIDTIKGFFDFSITWPNIPMPKFSITPVGWQIGDLLKGSIPHLGITWEAKAKEAPYMFTGATLFGAGEAGDEILYGRQRLLDDIRQASGGGQPTNNTFYITVDGAENPEEFADLLVRRLKLNMRTA